MSDRIDRALGHIQVFLQAEMARMPDESVHAEAGQMTLGAG